MGTFAGITLMATEPHRRIVVAGLVVVCGLLAPVSHVFGQPPPGFNMPMPFEVVPLAEGPDPGPIRSLYLAITDQQEWERVWSLMRTSQIRPHAPDVDFSKRTLLVASLGQQRTCCPHLVFETVLDQGDSLLVLLCSVRGRNRGVDPTRQVSFALIPRTEKPVTFKMMEAFADTGYVRCR